MDAELQKIVDRLTTELETWLAKPSSASEKIAAIQQQLDELKATVGASVSRDMLKPLERAAAEANRARQREAAEAIAQLCRPLGIALDAKEPPKRTRKRPTNKDASQAGGVGSSPSGA